MTYKSVSKNEFLSSEINRYQAKAKAIVVVEMILQKQFNIAFDYIKKHVLKKSYDYVYIGQLFG